MEELRAIVVEKWPEILSYALNFVAYFLFLLYRARFSKTKNTMRVMFNDKVAEVNTTDTRLRAEIESEHKAILAELNRSIEEYEEARKIYLEGMAEMEKTRKALAEIIAEEVVENGTDVE